MIEDLATRTARWSIATGEVLDGLRQIRACLDELGVSDDDGSALVTCLGLLVERAEPPEITVIESGDSGDDGDTPDPDPLLPVIITPSATTP